MKVFVNEKIYDVNEGATVFKLRDIVKNNADIVIYNGFVIKEDYSVKENDKIVFIKRGEMPKNQDMEALLMARHTPLVHSKIKQCTVGVAGLGGLGSNVAVALARTGVGKLILTDFDVVEPSNLNRQQYFIKHIGMKKTEAIEEIIKNCNPFVKIEKRNVFLDQSNIEHVFKNADIIVEAFDNAESKALIVNLVLTKMKEKKIVAASGMAGYFESNTIITRKIRDNFYMVGDGESEAKPGLGLMSPRVAIAANHQANAVLRIILGEM